jgi:uncharacterized protein (TIGR02646 family)
MRTIVKGEAPQILAENARLWTKEYMRARRSPPVPDVISFRYRHEEIKAALIQEASGKCVYCESKMLHVSPGDIDHLLPSKRFPRKRFDWANLTLSCPVCNRNKSDYYSRRTPLLNPYDDNVERLLVHYGPLVSAADSNRSARQTIDKLDLNRAELWLRKRDRLKNIDDLVQVLLKETDPARKAVMLAALQEEATLDKEFSAMVAAFLEQTGVMRRPPASAIARRRNCLGFLRRR